MYCYSIVVCVDLSAVSYVFINCRRSWLPVRSWVLGMWRS